MKFPVVVFVTGLSLAISGLLMTLCLFIGRGLPSETLVFFKSNDGRTVQIFLVDTGQNLVHRSVVPKDIQHVNRVDDACRGLTLGEHNWIRPTFYDTFSGQQRDYRPEYAQNGDAVEWLPDSRRIWTILYDSDTREWYFEIYDTISGDVVPVLLSGDSWDVEMSWSSDSRYAVVYHNLEPDNKGYLLDTATGALTPLEKSIFRSTHWSPDNRYAANTDRSSGVVILDTLTMTETVYRYPRFSGGIDIAWTADNRLRFFAGDGVDPAYRAYVWSPDMPEPEPQRIRLPQRLLSNITLETAWSPDAMKFYYLDYRRQGHVLDADTGIELAVLPVPSLPEASPPVYMIYNWSPDSRYLAANDSLLNGLTIADTTTGQLWRIPFTPAALDGNWIMPRWRDATTLEVFERSTGRAGLIHADGTPPEFVPVYQIPGTYVGVFCRPEGA